MRHGEPSETELNELQNPCPFNFINILVIESRNKVHNDVLFSEMNGKSPFGYATALRSSIPFYLDSVDESRSAAFRIDVYNCNIF